MGQAKPQGQIRDIEEAQPCAEIESQGIRQESRQALSQPCRQHERSEGEKEMTAAKKTRDPKGGLTAAGRAEFRKTEGANLKPGVKKKQSEMSPEELRRKGSWASRFYGRAKLPALVKDAKPTRFALTAAAWGEPVPKTEAAARRIAEKGKKLLARYQALKERQRKNRAVR
jgi:Domain of unknown function (DUF6321)